VRWHARLCLALRSLRPADAALALAAIRGIGDGEPRVSAAALRGLLVAYGEADCVRALEEWLARATD
jgi:hypothetical protein